MRSGAVRYQQGEIGEFMPMACDQDMQKVRHVIMNAREPREAVEEQLGTYFAIAWEGWPVFLRTSWFRSEEEDCLARASGKPCGIIIDSLDSLELINDYVKKARRVGAKAVYGLTSCIRISTIAALMSEPIVLDRLYITHTPEQGALRGHITLLL